MPRTGPVGKLSRWLGESPLLGGMLFGVLAVLIAGARAFQGVKAEPMIAALLSAIVIAAWMILFFLMRGFFTAQSSSSREVIRRIRLDQKSAQWEEEGRVLRRVDNPQVRLVTTPVPDGVGEGRGMTAWPVWIVVESAADDETGQDRMIFETRDSARRARDYEAVSDEVIGATDERLPRAIAAALLPDAHPIITGKT